MRKRSASLGRQYSDLEVHTQNRLVEEHEIAQAALARAKGASVKLTKKKRKHEEDLAERRALNAVEIEKYAKLNLAIIKSRIDPHSSDEQPSPTGSPDLDDLIALGDVTREQAENILANKPAIEAGGYKLISRKQAKKQANPVKKKPSAYLQSASVHAPTVQTVAGPQTGINFHDLPSSDLRALIRQANATLKGRVAYGERPDSSGDEPEDEEADSEDESSPSPPPKKRAVDGPARAQRIESLSQRTRRCSRSSRATACERAADTSPRRTRSSSSRRSARSTRERRTEKRPACCSRHSASRSRSTTSGTTATAAPGRTGHTRR